MTEKSKRPRGAPKGNTNALIHGFYARKPSDTERTIFRNSRASGLQGEIDLLRYQIRSFVDLFNTTEKLDIKIAITLMRVISLACLSLNRMLLTQAFYFPKTKRKKDIIDPALFKEIIEFAKSLPCKK